MAETPTLCRFTGIFLSFVRFLWLRAIYCTGPEVCLKPLTRLLIAYARSTEWEEWFSGKRDESPETDIDGYYVSQIPVILFQMVQQQV